MNNSCKFVKLVDKILLSVLTQDSALRAQRFVFRPQPIVQALFIILFLLADKAEAALPTWIDTLQVSTGITTSLHTPPPFWSTANQDGRNSALSTQHSALNYRLRLNKSSDLSKTLDYNYGLDLTQTNKEVVPTDAFIGLTYKSIKLSLGRKSEFFGLADSLLSVGPEVYTRNAPTIPKISIATNGYISINPWLAVNAYFGSGWMGPDQQVKNLYLQQKFLFLRFGGTNIDKGINFYAGAHDLCWWGGDGNPSSLKDFFRAFFAFHGGTDATKVDQIGSLGDHRGTIEFALKYKEDWQDWFLYCQTMYEDSSGFVFIYPGDYLIGGSWINKYPNSRITRINIELLDTRNDGYNLTHEYDNYFNGQYGGWVNQGYAIGHPFIPFTQTGPNSYTAQNRVRGISLGIITHFSDAINPVFRIAQIAYYGSFLGNYPLLSKPTNQVIAIALTNTSILKNNYTLTQQLYLDTSTTSKPNTALGLTLTKSF